MRLRHLVFGLDVRDIIVLKGWRIVFRPRCPARPFGVGHTFFIRGFSLTGRGRLLLSLVEVESRVQFRLSGKKLFQSRFMLKGSTELLAILREHFCGARGSLPLAVEASLERAERVLDALDGADGTLGIELRR